MNLKKICDYIFELGTLKKFEHSGTKLAGIKHPDSVAEHVYRTAIIGFILAKMEKADANKTAMMCLVHDNGECRITDLHRVARRYIKTEEAELSAFEDQVTDLPEDIGSEFLALFKEYEEALTAEGQLAREADMLETAFQAKEYLDSGYKACQDWIDNVGKCIKSPSSKKIFSTLQRTNFTDWWRGLKKLDKY